MNTGSISICEVRPDSERAAILRLLERNLPEAAAGGRFEWLYLGNPCGPARVWLARSEGGDAIGTSAAFPQEFKVAGRVLQALVLSDFVIDPGYRSLGPAMCLLRATLESVGGDPCRFALDHPSESMLAVYKRLGGSALGAQTRYVRLLKASGVTRRRWGAGVRATFVGAMGDLGLKATDRLRRRPTGLTATVHEGSFGAEFRRVGAAIERRRPVFCNRAPEYLNWRFRSGVRFSYATVTVRAANELLAYAILQTGEKSSITIVEFVCPPEEPLENALFTGIVSYGHEWGAEALQASAVDGSAWSSVLAGHGFSAREQSTGPVVFVQDGDACSEMLTDVGQWWMTDGDRDG